MTKVRNILFVLGVLAVSLLGAPRALRAQTAPGGGPLSEAQQALLGAGVAEKKPYAALIRQAVADGMDCEEVVAFLCGKGGNDPTLVSEIVYAAITAGCDAGKVVSGALRSGAGLQNVVRAAQAAGASRGAITAAATKNGYTPVQIGNAFAGTGGGTPGGGPLGGGPLGGGPGGPAIGGGAGGAAPASPHKP